MLYDETAVRDNIRNRDGKRVFYLGKEDRLTPSAKDYLSSQRVEILPVEEAKVTRYRLLGGGFVEEKPEHMTHLQADLLAPKNHPRIRFRGAIDILEAELLLCQHHVPYRAGQLGEILALTRKLIRCDVLNEPVDEVRLCGLTEEEQRKRSHFPQNYYGQPHFMPEVVDGEKILWLNRCRCVCRAAELAAVDAFTDGEGNPTRIDILRALNRMSSMLYILMIGEKAGK